MKIKKGSIVKLDYEGTLDDGEVFDSTSHGDHSHPLEFTVGEGHVIKGFDEAVIGMEKDQEKKFKIEVEDAYGAHRSELVLEFDKKMLPPEQEPEVGMPIMMANHNGGQVQGIIVWLTHEKMKIDFNHPLAGKRLNFKIKIVSVEN